MISTPYPKYLNAVMDVDMSAAVIVTDAETARERGLAPDSVAYVRGWADAYEVWYLSQRAEVRQVACTRGLLHCGARHGGRQPRRDRRLRPVLMFPELGRGLA